MAPHLFTALGIFATALAASNNATSSGAEGACGELATLYPDLLLTRNSTNYTVEATHYWDMKANLKPLCIFQPTNADQVANSVTLFNKYQAHFAVRGGGHMNVSDQEPLNTALAYVKIVRWLKQHRRWSFAGFERNGSFGDPGR